MDNVVELLVARGVPGLVLLVAVAMNGLTGAAAVVAALAALGGPFGILGGLGLLGVVTLISSAIGTFGVNAVFCRVVEELYEEGMTKRQIRKKIDSYPISRGLKQKLYDHLDRV